MNYMFSDGKDAVTMGEAMEASKNLPENKANAIGSATVGIQNDKSQGTTNNVVAGEDPLATLLINNGVARNATINYDPCKEGKERWYIQTPYVINDTAVGADEESDQETCCVSIPSFEGCRYRLGINELCVKDCVATSLDEMMEDEVTIKAIDTTLPLRSTGDSLARARAKVVSRYTRFIMARNAILGTPTFKKSGMRPFDGLLSRLTDKRTLVLDGSAGVIAAVMMLDCRLRALGMSATDYLIAVNPVLTPTLQQEVRTYMKTDPFTLWRIDDSGSIFYNKMRLVESRYVDVDLTTNTTSVWLIDPSKVGIKFIRPLTDPYIKRHESADDCGGHCITFHNAGTTVITDWTGLVLIKNVGLSAICDSLALSGLENFMNSGVVGHLYPKVTA